MPYVWDPSKQAMVWVGQTVENPNQRITPTGTTGTTYGGPYNPGPSPDDVNEQSFPNGYGTPQGFASAGPAFAQAPSGFQYPGATSQEQELLDLILQDYKDRMSLKDKNRGLIDEALAAGYDLSAEEKADIENATGIYQSTRNKALEEDYTMADKKIRAKFAAQGILDSSVAGDTYSDLEKNKAELSSKIADSTALFKLGTTEQIREARRKELMQKIGILQSETSPAQGLDLFRVLAAQRSSEANALLQYALGEASSGGDSGLLSSLFGIGGAVVGGVYGGPAGAAVGYGAGSNLGGSF